MSSTRQRDNRMKKLTIMALVIGLAMLLSTPVFAYELGIAWINDYPGAGNDLDYCDDNAIGFKNELSWYSVDYEESDGDVLESHLQTMAIVWTNLTYHSSVDIR